MEKALPLSLEAEYGILGSIVIDPDVLASVADYLKPEDFYRNAHKVIYQTMLSLYHRHEAADFITVVDDLERQGKLESVGGAGYITGLVNLVPTSGNIEYYAHIVEETSKQRRLIQVAAEIAALAYERDPKAMEKAEALIYGVNQGKRVGQVISLSDAIDEFMTKLDVVHERHRQGKVSGIPTNFKAIDQVLGGLQPSDLITLAARPAVGKTSLCLNIAYQIMGDSYRAGKNVLMFSLEMGREQLVRRLISMESHVDQVQLRNGSFEEESWEKIVSASDNLREGQMWIDDTAGLSLTDMRSRARRTQQEHGLDLIIVDYMQLMKALNDNGKIPDNRVQEVSMLSRGLKELARELNVPVLALAQLSRAVEQRQSKVPQLSDLRESGSIEMDSDVVMFIHRDEKMPLMNNGYILNIMIAKHRNGPVGIAPLLFNPQLTRFFNLEDEFEHKIIDEYRKSESGDRSEEEDEDL